jgi:hypothetical protein
MLLARIKHSAATVTEVIATAGMLEDDIEPPVVRWFHAKTAELPEADAPRTGRLAGRDAQRQHHPAPVQIPRR